MTETEIRKRIINQSKIDDENEILKIAIHQIFAIIAWATLITLAIIFN
mgnify:CR=1 FL=1